MQIAIAQKLAEQTKKQLEVKYLFLKQWDLKMDKAKRRAGACLTQSKTISLSEWHVAHNEYEVVIDTLLHEFAHAIAFELFGDISHGKRWKHIALELGATPRSTGKFNLPKSPWMLVSVCKSTLSIEKVAPRYRRNKKIKNYFLRGKPSTKGSLYYLEMAEFEQFEQKKIRFEHLNFVR